MADITVAIDKLDKIGMDKVLEELYGRGLETGQVSIIKTYLEIEGNHAEKIARLRDLLGANETGHKGIAEIEYILERVQDKVKENILVDFTLARGLNYYTGIIFEIKAKNVQMGSIGGGGRYDDLTGLFGVPGIPGVGIYFGVDRIYDVMEELHLFPEDVHTGTQVLFFNLGEAEGLAAFALLQQLREKGIRSELYHEKAKFDKQFKYAEKKNIPFVIILGSKELAENTCIVKDIRSGEQKVVEAGRLFEEVVERM
jgi:histidyl-tRNA synthetase